MLAPNQWKTSLQSNAVSHWLGANLESALQLYLPIWLNQIPNAISCTLSFTLRLWSSYLSWLLRNLTPIYLITLRNSKTIRPHKCHLLSLKRSNSLLNIEQLLIEHHLFSLKRTKFTFGRRATIERKGFTCPWHVQYSGGIQTRKLNAFID